MARDTPLTFPPSFLFGTATSATQVEGGCQTLDWWSFAREPGRIAHGDTPDVACDHWNRFQDDVGLQTALGLEVHRFSVEWGRLEPRDGTFDDDVLHRYREEVRALRHAGIEPMVTLHHFTFPSWLAERGGVLAPEFPARFAALAGRVGRALASDVRLWVTVNEPNVLLAQGFLLGAWPPAKRAPHLVPSAILALRRAHVAAYRALHDTVKGAQVGLAHALRVMTPGPSLADRAVARGLDLAFNGLFLDLPQDYLGVNYYSRDVVRFAPTRPGELFASRGVAAGAPVSDLGWEIYPEGLGVLLRRLAPRRKPIWITENGIADARDRLRGGFLLDHLREIALALREGVDVRGYCHWSLMDNFEWAEGYGPRFGLYAVDYATQARTLRASGALYRRIARERRLD